jgi:competence protein ComEC
VVSIQAPTPLGESLSPAGTDAPSPARPPDVGLAVWQAPLVPIALAVSLGIVADRYLAIDLTVSLIGGLAMLLAFVCHGARRHRGLALVYLWAGCAALGCAYHHWHRVGVAADDVRHQATDDGRPARLRGTIDSPPQFTKAGNADPLRSMARKDSTRFVLRVTSAYDPASGAWHSASGRVQVNAPAQAADVAAGAVVEVVGRLSIPEAPANPGEFDYAAHLTDREISAVLSAREAGSVVVLEERPLWSPGSWPAVVRGWGQDVLTGALPAPEGDLAAALLLGDSPGMTTDDWDLYQRTGVIHVLAISGQHLVVLAAFLWAGLRLARVRRRRGAVLVALVLLAYALVAGGRPPVMRSAWMVLVYAGGIVLLQPTHPANTFALAWLLVVIFNPADLFNAGCQLSFLAVAVLVWGISDIVRLSHYWRYPFGSRDPLQQVIDESRPWPLQMVHSILRTIVQMYIVNALVWLAVTPLVAFHFHLVSPIALALGPILVMLTSIALMAGFAVLLLAPLAGPLAWPFALVAHWSLAGCAGVTRVCADVPGAYFYVPDIPLWWLAFFYGVLLVALAVRLPVTRPGTAVALLLGGLGLGLLVTLWPHRPGEYRCTFLAVGHGGCAVIETPDGHVLLYDTGSIAGPDLTRRQIAPFLWSRGIRRIDEVILSHADLDHFNGLPALLERFAVRQITHTPTWPQRDIEAIRVVLATIERYRVPRRVVFAGARWRCDDVALEVLHPPADGPEGKENVRSLVLHLHYHDVSILLTGDLEDAGLAQVLAMAPRRVDVLMAPHHGSARSNTPQLARWASPRVVVIAQGRSDDTSLAARAYRSDRTIVLGTWPHGAITLRQNAAGAWVETFRTRRHHALRENYRTKRPITMPMESSLNTRGEDHLPKRRTPSRLLTAICQIRRR